MANKDEKDVIVIGAGPGGYAAAFKAADLGLNVTIIDPEVNPGGTCLYEGCIPAKTILKIFELKEEAIKAREWGLHFEDPEIDLKKVTEWKENVVGELTEGIGLLAEERNIEFIRGKAAFKSEKELEVETNEGENLTIKFKNAIIATGAKTKEHPKVKFDHEKILNSTDALALKEVPEKLLVIGGGFIGMELGSVYASLGSKVTVVETTSRFLSWVDQDLVEVFMKENEGLFEKAYFETDVENVNVDEKKIKVKLKNKNGEWEEEYDKVLVAVGREPNTKAVRLEKAGIEPDKDGFIKVDEKRQTKRKNIYAIGDITEKPLYANKATHEGQIVAEAIAGVEGAVFDPKVAPTVVATTRGEIAWCGLTEMEAEEAGLEIKVAKFPWSASGRATSMGINKGLTKLILEPETGRVLGGGVAGKKAGSLISEIAFAIEMAATAGELSNTIHPHPTLSETIMEAAEVFLGSATHLPNK